MIKDATKGDNVKVTMGYYSGQRGVVTKANKVGVFVKLNSIGCDIIFGRIELVRISAKEALQ